MSYLLDTCVPSEFVKPAPDEAVLAWVSQQREDRLFIAAMSMAELHRGIARLPVSKRKQELAVWVERLEESFEDRILPFTQYTAHHWAGLFAAAEMQGKKLAAFDSIIAATALEHGLTLVTRNERDFSASLVTCLNPWKTGI